MPTACPPSTRARGAGLPPGIDLSAYRIVQEALTNVLRHAGATEVTISVNCEPEAVALMIADNGRSASDGDLRPGNGLLGMRERATLAGRTFDAGPRSGAVGATAAGAWRMQTADV